MEKELSKLTAVVAAGLAAPPVTPTVYSWKVPPKSWALLKTGFDHSRFISQIMPDCNCLKRQMLKIADRNLLQV